MMAESPTLDPAIAAVCEYADAHASELSSEQTQTLLEVVRRLRRLKVQAAELIRINNTLWSKESLNISLDSASDTLISGH